MEAAPYDEGEDAPQCRVLVVDDEPAIVALLEQVLCDSGMRVLTAGNGSEALSILGSNQVDVVLSDICMHGLSGIELISHIHNADNTLKVILMTGFDSYDMVKASFQAGAYDYLEKPLNDHELVLSATRRACESVRLLRRNSQLVGCLQSSNTKLTAANKRLMQLNKQLRKLAITDGLTQLYNRRYIDDWIHNYVVSNAQHDYCLSVVLMDVDHFKAVNDTYGHDAGDDVLRDLAAVLRSFGRESDLVGRYGGEEFVVIMPQTDAQEVVHVAERLRKLICRQPVELESGPVNISVSLGIASLPANTSTDGNLSLSGRDLIALADRALYVAKDRGRNTSVHHDEIAAASVGRIPPLQRAANQ